MILEGSLKVVHSVRADVRRPDAHKTVVWFGLVEKKPQVTYLPI